MAFVADYEPNPASTVHMTMASLIGLAEQKIEHWDGDAEHALDARGRRSDNWKEWLLITVDHSDRHLVRRSGTLHETAGVLVTAFLRDRPQLNRFLIAAPVVTDDQIKETVVTFERLLRPTIEIAARVRWAGELAELNQVRRFDTRFPFMREICETRFGTPYNQGKRAERISDLTEWLETDYLYPPA